MDLREKVKNNKVIVMAVEHYNTLGLIRSLGEVGLSPIYIAIKGKARVASTSKYISTCHYVDNEAQAYSILVDNYRDENNKAFVLCIDDKTVSYMDERYDNLKDYFYFFNAGSVGQVNKYMDKLNILKAAEKCGLKTLRAYRCSNGDLPGEIKYPVITKAISPVIGGWKSDVHICNSESELLDAYQNIQASEVLVQEYIEKKNEYCLEGFSFNHGKDMLVTIASTYNYLLPNYYSPYMTVCNMDDQELHKKLNDLMKLIGFEGIYEIEFLIGQDDTLYFGEINFRNSTWSYASTVAGMNLPALWIESTIDGFMPESAYVKIERPFTGMVEPIDYGKRVDTGKATLAEWLADFKDAKCLYYYNENDREPFYEMIKNFEILK